MNIYYAEKTLIPKERKEIDGITYRITRWADEKHFFKQIIIDHGGEPVEYIEQVAKFDLNNFDKMFSGCGLKIEKVYGDYELDVFDKNKSPRLIMIATKS